MEIYYSGRWSTISDTSWTSSDAAVVCRQLRHSAEGYIVYSTPTTAIICAYYSYKNRICKLNDLGFCNNPTCTGAVPLCCGQYGEGSGSILVNSVSCSGYEETISSCYVSTSTVFDHQNAVGVQCQQGKT